MNSLPLVIPNCRAWTVMLLFAGLAVIAANGQPLNDNFSRRTVVAGSNVTITGSLAGATVEVGEPGFPGISGGQTAWWTWTPTENGSVTLSFAGAGPSPLLTAYTGDNLSSLSLIASNSHLVCYQAVPCGCHWRTRKQSTFHVTSGQAYHIAIDSPILTDTSYEIRAVQFEEVTAFGWQPVSTTNVFSIGAFDLGVRFTSAPNNDDFEDRVELRGSRTHISASNAGATRQSGETDHLGNPGGSSVWYSWRAPTSGRVTLSPVEIPRYPPPSTYGSVFTYSSGMPDCGQEIDQNPPAEFFPVFAAYTGATLDSLQPANCVSLPLMGSRYAVAFDAIEGQRYEIAFDGNMGTIGTIALHLAMTTPAANDEFKRRIKLRGIHVIATGYNAGATQEPGEPVPPPRSSGKTVWWSWTAPVSGPTTINLDGSDFSFPITVWRGSTVSNLQPVGMDHGNLSFEAVAGETYEIAIGDVDGRTGAIKLTLQAPVVAASLDSVEARRRTAVFRYAAVPGQKILLQRSTNGTDWQNRRVAIARRGFVEFPVSIPPGGATPSYRAIIVDWIPR